jgi:hypothetical protein
MNVRMASDPLIGLHPSSTERWFLIRPPLSAQIPFLHFSSPDVTLIVCMVASVRIKIPPLSSGLRRTVARGSTAGKGASAAREPWRAKLCRHHAGWRANAALPSGAEPSGGTSSVILCKRLATTEVERGIPLGTSRRLSWENPHGGDMMLCGAAQRGRAWTSSRCGAWWPASVVEAEQSF